MPRSIHPLLRWSVALALATALPVAAAEPEARPRVELDRLLELPSSREYTVDKRGGLTRSEWRGRFVELREKLRSEEEALAKAETELEEIAASTEPWQLGPPLPGVTQADAPLDYRLRQAIRRHRDEIERLEDRLTELRVQANLAGVPETWRE